MIIFELPVDALASPNAMLRTNRYVRKKMRKTLAWQVVAAIADQRPPKPFARVTITIERHAPRLFDPDNLAGSVKNLLDILQPASKKRHPIGLGVIASDAPNALQLITNQAKCRGTEARVIVKIEPIPEVAAA